ncbi:ImmA/IrrE family metallo-endopeptidase [Paenibacillus sp. SYP-B4298]|uniref:ImmA/IrrE family metallo-endopeptidase n=1 Tax=Paenibacillus sp. SYP-B4298 TaxID=2996034 RepID=UPI0022DD85A9|nr:ImmA/IrrE family metallo-endopeptidase [Paenibacillus sp. SYP-B4298]
MPQFDTMLALASGLGLAVFEMDFESSAKALIKGKKIAIRKSMDRTTKACALCEEIGHDQTGAGDIIDQSSISNRQQEVRARQWAHHCLIPFERIIDAHKARISGRYELAEFLGVTEEFLQSAIDRFTAKYGIFLKVNDQYTIKFDPLGVLEIFP